MLQYIHVFQYLPSYEQDPRQNSGLMASSMCRQRPSHLTNTCSRSDHMFNIPLFLEACAPEQLSCDTLSEELFCALMKINLATTAISKTLEKVTIKKLRIGVNHSFKLFFKLKLFALAQKISEFRRKFNSQPSEFG